MTWIIVGLGNPGAEYEKTRHNTGRMVVEYFAQENGDEEWKKHAASQSLVSKGSVGKTAYVCVLPETFMNKSGVSVLKHVKSVKAAEKCIVVYDDLDLPLGSMKMSFNRGSGGHKGIESIARTLKTKAFWRLRVGVSPTTPSGKLKKPSGEDTVLDFILGSFGPKEELILKSVCKRAAGILRTALTEGPVLAMNECNSA